MPLKSNSFYNNNNNNNNNKVQGVNDLGKRLVDMRARVEQTIYLVFQKIRATFIFMITSAIVDQFSYFSLLNSEMICGKRMN